MKGLEVGGLASTWLSARFTLARVELLIKKAKKKGNRIANLIAMNEFDSIQSHLRKISYLTIKTLLNLNLNQEGIFYDKFLS